MDTRTHEHAHTHTHTHIHTHTDKHTPTHSHTHSDLAVTTNRVAAQGASATGKIPQTTVGGRTPGDTQQL